MLDVIRTNLILKELKEVFDVTLNWNKVTQP
jgi:hypothetical protein